MTYSDDKKKKQKRTVAQKLRTVIVILLFIVAAIVLGGLYIINQQRQGKTVAPLAKLQEMLPGRDQGSTAAPADPETEPTDGQETVTANADQGRTEIVTATPAPGRAQTETGTPSGGTQTETGTPSGSAQTETGTPSGSTQTETGSSSGTEQETVQESADDALLGSVGTPAHGEDVVMYDGKQYVYNNHLSNYLMLGIDTDGDIQLDKKEISAGQSDAMYLVSYDRKEETAQILAIPRDTMTEIQILNDDGQFLGTTVSHITLQYAYGDGKRRSCELACDAVSHLLYELPILGYASLNTESIPLLADVVGGVPLTLEDNSLEDIYPGFTRGSEVVITTENAEKFLRYRDTHQHQQALVRMDRQKVFINAFIEKLKALQKEDPHTVTDVYETLKPHMVTNMGNDVFLDLAAAKREGSIKTVPGKGVNTELYDEYEVDEKALYKLILEMFYKEVEE